nr:EamA family transporter [Azospirillum sp. B510]
MPFTLIAWAERTVEAGTAVILNVTTPIFAFLITLLLTRHEELTVGKAVGVGAVDEIGRDLPAQGAIILATVCYAGAAIYGRAFKGLDPIMPAAGSLLCGAALLLPISVVVDRPWTLAPSGPSLLALAGLSVFSTALAFVLYFRLVDSL